MPIKSDELTAAALGSLSGAERQSAIVYRDDRTLPAGHRIRLGDLDAQPPWPSVVFFVDLEPAVNWGHRCCYLLVNPDTREVRRLDAQFPPFLKGAPATLRLAWRGPAAPAWAVAVEE